MIRHVAALPRKCRPASGWLAAAMALLLTSGGAPARAYAPACLRALPIPVRVRIGPGPAVDALLRGGVAPALALIHRDSGRLLWSAAAHPPASQRFPAMHAAFAGSLIALDLDGDGLQDRLYAGDLGGRIWRFDLHHGAAAAAWATGGVFADFSNPSGRGFIAPPDVSLSLRGDGEPWFNIAIGTAAPGNVITANRYYVLRDYAPFAAWSAGDYEDWRPLRETDLLRLTRPREADDEEIGSGYFIELARGEVLSSSLTVAGRAVLAIADTATTAAAGCQVAVSIATLELDSATAPDPARNAPWRERLPGRVETGASFNSGTVASEGVLPCTLSGQRVAACDVDTKPRRTWWRREDVE